MADLGSSLCRFCVTSSGRTNKADRFESKDDVFGPTVATWRCNLVRERLCEAFREDVILAD